MLCLLLSGPRASAQIIANIDIISSITPLPQQNCDEIGFCAQLNSFPPAGTVYRWQTTDFNGTVSFFTTTTPCITVPVPAVTVQVTACAPSTVQRCLQVGFEAASIPPLSQFLLTPNGGQLNVQRNNSSSLSFTGNRCFDDFNVTEAFFPGSSGSYLTANTTTNETTFSTSATLTVSASSTAPYGNQNWVLVTAEADPTGEEAFGVYQVRVFGPIICCISELEANASTETESDGVDRQTEISSEFIPFTAEQVEFYQIDRIMAALQRGEMIPKELENNLLRGLNEEITPATGELEVFPNPASQLVNLRFSDAPSVMRILNSEGRELRKVTGTDKLGSGVSLDISELRPGIYFVETVTADGQRSVKRLSVAR